MKDSNILHSPGRMTGNDMGFHNATQNRMQFKTCKFVFWNFLFPI